MNMERHKILNDKYVQLCRHNENSEDANVSTELAEVTRESCTGSGMYLPEIFGIEIDLDDNEVDIDVNMISAHRDELNNIILDSYIAPKNISICPLDYYMKIHLTTDVPFHCTPRRVSYRERTMVQEIVDQLQKDGIVRPSSSLYASAIVLVKKKMGGGRLCVDYRGLNKITVRDKYPLPLIKDCLEYLEGKKIFTLLDLKSGFHQVNISPESIPYTAFVTPNGRYEYVKMPFGLKIGPAVFQRFINEIFLDMVNERKIIIHMDDILIATADFDEHKSLVQKVLQRIMLRNLKLNLKKCKFGYNRIEYLGYSVSSNGISLSESHIAATKRYPIPTNQKELHSCLGLFSYFRRFVPSFSKISRPLQNLLKQNAVFKFDEGCLGAFHYLKIKLSEAPVLAIYSPKRETELHCDASAIGFGAVLLQRQDDAKFHPISYFSKTTTNAEARYHSFELETLAIIYALQRFRVYLEGITFKIVTDCNSLTMTLGKRQVNSRIAIWALELENYDYHIQHRGGASMGHVDALRRSQIASILGAGDVDSLIQVTQERDDVIRNLKTQLEISQLHDFELIEGLVYRVRKNGRKLLYVPHEMEQNVIRLILEKIGHQAVEKSYDKTRLYYCFPGMREKIERFIQSCIKCIMYATPVRETERNFYNIEKRPVPFDSLHIDHFGPLPCINSKRKHILVVIDAFTKFVKLYPTNSTSTREVTNILDKYFNYYSRPRRIITDRGTCFTSLEFGDFLLKRNISHVKVAVASPQANGQVERVNRVIKAMLGKVSDSISHADWATKLGKVEYAINNSFHSTTQNTPSMLLFGVEQRGEEIDELTEYLSDRNNQEGNRDLTLIRENAEKAIVKSQNYNLSYFLRHSKPAKVYDVGDFILIRNVDTAVGTNKKFSPKYKGPYVVHKILGNDRYVIRDIENCQLTQLPYDGVVEANRMRKWMLKLDALNTDVVNIDENRCNNELNVDDDKSRVDIGDIILNDYTKDLLS